MKKTFKITSVIVLSLIGLLVLIAVLVNVPAVQNFLVQRITARLSDDLNTRVSIRHVDFHLFNKFTAEGVFIADHRQDTLLYTDELTLNVNDFFFIKRKTIFHYIGLNGAVIHINRPKGDSVWNYQFLVDAFSSPAPSGEAPPPAIDLRKINLENIRVDKTDAWIGEDMHLYVNAVTLDARKLDLRRRQLFIQKITLDKPAFMLVDYAASRPPEIKAQEAAAPPADSDALQWNKGEWNLLINQLTIHDGAFGLLNKEQPKVERGFDPAHIAVYDINASLDSIRWIKDSILSQVELSAKERSGVEIKKMHTRFKLSPVEMEFADLDLTTNKSHLRDYFSMSFSDFGDMSDFVTKVFMKADFKDAYISSDDIAFFAPPLADWKKEISASGNAYGTVSNLSGNNLDIQAGAHTKLEGRIKMRGLPNIDETFIDFQATRLLTTGEDIQRFIPSGRLKGIDLNQAGNILFSGNFVGFIHDFVAYGDFNTGLGFLHSDLNMKWGSRHKIPLYSGKLSVKDFDFGALLHQDKLGAATFEAAVNGRGFDFNNLQAALEAGISNVTLNGYTYHNIETKGTFEKKLFNGILSIDDPNAALNFHGSIDFNDSLPVFNFQSEIFHSDLRALGFTRDSITFSSRLDLNFQGDNIDNFLGDARLHDIALYKNKVRVEVDSFNVHSSIRDQVKMIRLQANEIDGYIKGKYNVQRLPDAVKFMLSRYYPNVVKKPDSALPGENFTFELHLGKVQKILGTFSSRLSGFDGTEVRGMLNTAADSLKLAVSVPRVGYDRYRIDDIEIRAEGRDSMLGINTTFQGMYVSDSLLLGNAVIRTTSHADTSFLNFRTRASNTLNNADIYTRVLTLPDGYKIKILNSEIVINDKDWHITPDNEITLLKNAITVYNFNISHNDQRISLTSDDIDSSIPSFLVNIEHLNIADFSQFLSRDTRLEGLLDGQIRVDDPLSKILVTGEVNASRFRVNNDSVGNVNVKATYDKVKGALQWDVQKKDDPQRNFAISGSAGLTGDNKQLSGDFQLNHTDISWLEGFARDYISDFKGTGTGKLTLSGTTDAPLLNGSIRLDSVGVKVNYLGTYYKLTNETIKFTNQAIDVGNITLHDSTGHTAVLNGQLTHNHFNDLNFNFHVTALNFQLLHTGVDDNSLYYGNVWANGKVDFTGPLSNMQMSVILSPQKGSHLYLPLADSKDVGAHDFIIFKQYGKEQKAVKRKSEKVNLTVKLQAIMNPNARIDVILDQTTGDMISATGNGALQMNVSLDGDFNMYGNYIIEDGYYNFSFRNLLNRRFKINSGSTISWNGDAGDAKVDITAIYNVPGGASLYDLIAGEVDLAGGANPSNSDIRQREKVDVYLNLKGSLAKPDITYDIRLPEAGINTGSAATTKLQQVKQDPNELLTQVTGLLVLGQFIPPSSSAANSNLLRSSGLSNAGQWVSSQLTGVLTNVLGSRLKTWGVDFNVNYNAYSASQSQGEGDPLQRNDVQLNLGKSFFDNRVHLEVGPSVDWGRANVNNQTISNSYFAGDFRVEYLITPDGHIRFFGFSRSNYDVLMNQNLIRSGIGIAYRRDFDKLFELFEDKKHRRYLDSLRRARIERLKEMGAEDQQLIRTDSSSTIPRADTTLPSRMDSSMRR